MCSEESGQLECVMSHGRCTIKFRGAFWANVRVLQDGTWSLSGQTRLNESAYQSLAGKGIFGDRLWYPKVLLGLHRLSFPQNMAW